MSDIETDFTVPEIDQKYVGVEIRSVPCFAVFCKGCGLNLTQEYSEYSGWDRDGVIVFLDNGDWYDCPVCGATLVKADDEDEE